VAARISPAQSRIAKERAALWSVAASGSVALVKLAAGLHSGSLALLSEAAHALADTGATAVTWGAVRWSGKPADEDHQYGHGKIEGVAALVETGVLCALALAVLVFAGRRLALGAAPVEASWLVFAVVGLSIAVDLNRIRVLRRAARETGSMALAADALHFASDMAGSIAVLAGLGCARLGFPAGDALAALAVACFIGTAGWRLGRRAFDTLVDAAPEGCAGRLRALASDVDGVVAVDSVRARSDGSRVFADMAVAVSRDHSLEAADAIADRVRETAAAEFPGIELTLATRATALDDATVRGRVLLAGARHHLPLHHVTVQEVEGRLSVSFDMEVDGAEPLSRAHGRAEEFKKALRRELGEGTEVEPHIEPMFPAPLCGEDAPARVVEEVGAVLREAAGRTDDISWIHDVRVRETAPGWVVNYHCRASGSLRVELVHRQMDALEHDVRSRLPRVVRIVGHADARE
jgi:cation diffusion facilitator family transporter